MTVGNSGGGGGSVGSIASPGYMRGAVGKRVSHRLNQRRIQRRRPACEREATITLPTVSTMTTVAVAVCYTIAAAAAVSILGIIDLEINIIGGAAAAIGAIVDGMGVGAIVLHSLPGC